MNKELPKADGNCYMIVPRVAEQLLLLGADEVRIVHGIAVGRGDIEGVRFGHAWVTATREGTTVVADWANDIHPRLIEIGAYYLLGQIKAYECVFYTIAEHKRMMQKHGNFGPWTQQHLSVA